jgi:hypothetical protein
MARKRPTASAASGLMVSAISNRHSPLPRGFDDGLAQRVFRIAFRRCGQAQHVAFGECAVRGHTRHARLALGDGARLIQHDGIDLVGHLERP